MREHTGRYCDFHMKGPTALPIAYAIRTIALVVIRLVWPAVTVPIQPNITGKHAIPHTVYGSKQAII